MDDLDAYDPDLLARVLQANPAFRQMDTERRALATRLLDLDRRYYLTRDQARSRQRLDTQYRTLLRRMETILHRHLLIDYAGVQKETASPPS